MITEAFDHRMNGLEIRKAFPSEKPFEDWDALCRLYESAFPACERRPMAELRSETGGMIEQFAFYHEGMFCGFVITLTTREIVHIIYLAITEDARGEGFGSCALAEIRRRNPAKRLIVDVERVMEGAANNAQRARRIAFYHRNGYRETKITYRWRGEDYIILACGGDVTKAEWEAFWDEVELKTGHDW